MIAEIIAALKSAGFEPEYNVCAACLHPGGRHDLNNRCLEPGCGDYFASMSMDERWEYGVRLALGGIIVALERPR